MQVVFTDMYGSAAPTKTKKSSTGGRLPGFGLHIDRATMGDVHTPQEHLSISSVQRTWKVLLAALEDAKYEKA